jgi:hypothetical protein
MKTYKDIDEFIIEAFPLEYDKIVKRNKTPVERNIERIDNDFDEELGEIMRGEDSNKK